MLLILDKTLRAARNAYKSVATITPADSSITIACRNLGYTDFRHGFTAVPNPGAEDAFERVTYRLLCIAETHYGADIVIPEEYNSAEWTARINAWENKQTNLLSCIKEFKWAYPELANPDSARGNCGVVSQQFLTFLRKRGVVSDGMIKEDRACVDGWESGNHWYTRVGDIIIDWTYRQFDPTCPFPSIYKAKAPYNPRKAYAAYH